MSDSTPSIGIDEAVEEVLNVFIPQYACECRPNEYGELDAPCEKCYHIPAIRAILTRLQPAPQEGGDKPSDTVLKEATGKIMAAKVYAEDGDVPGGLLIAREEAVDILSAAITSASGDKPSDTKKEEQIRNLSCMAGRAFGEVEGGEVNLEYNCAMRVLGETIQHLGVLSGLSIRKPESDVADFIKKNYGLWT